MSKTVTVDNVQDYIGQITGESDWFQITQEQINKFAEATHDHQFIHVDPEKAKETMFGSTIAHGFLTLSMISHLAVDGMLKMDNLDMVVNYGGEKVRFMSPVKVDQKIRAVCKLADAQVKGAGKRVLFKYEITMEIEGEKRPALIAEWLMMFMLKKEK